jgi:DNA-binding NtrC family response regulator
MKKGHILIIDDNKNVRTALRILLERHFESVTLLPSPKQLHSQWQEAPPDVVLLDMNFSAGINTGNEGLHWLSEIKKQDADLPVILITAYADIDLAVTALKQGATDFVVKPWDNTKLIATIQAAHSLRESRKEVIRLREQQHFLNRELNRYPAICWGASHAMQSLRQLIQKIAQTEANILLTGENGTGKELIAREIHRLSPRHKEALIIVDIGAITESLFESELFGHLKGAFTDAKTARTGKFEAANHGTLFLDEIGNLPYPLQAKLLHTLQSRQVTRIGDNRPLAIDIRLISATNRNVQESVQKGTFREDLLYRINTIQIEIPPLRERREDIPPLAGFFLNKYTKKYAKEPLSLTPEAIRHLQAYHWPGNVRELQHTIEKATILAETNTLQSGDIYLNQPFPTAIEFDNMTLDEAEKTCIRNALNRNQRNLSATAAALGISRPTLYHKMQKYDL